MKIVSIIPKLPYINKEISIVYYKKLGFDLVADYENYLILQKDDAEIHLFEFKNLNPTTSDFMVYIRIKEGIDSFYLNIQQNEIEIHPNGKLELKPWKQKEFSLLDPNGT